MLKIFSILLMTLIMTLAVTTLSFINPSFSSDQIASAGRYKVTKQEAELAAKMAGLGNSTENNSQFDKLSTSSKKIIIQKLINDKILEELAKKEDVDQQNDVAMAIRAILVSKYIEKHSENLEALARKRYDETTASLRGKKTYTLSHILVKSEMESVSIYKSLLNAGTGWKSKFKRLAKDFSIDEATAKNGGFVGSVPEIKLPEDFLRYIRAAKANIIIGPFKTSLGYHVAFVEKIEPVHIEPYNKVKQVFIGQAFQEETERLAAAKLKGKEIKFEFETEK